MLVTAVIPYLPPTTKSSKIGNFGHALENKVCEYGTKLADTTGTL